MRSLSNRSVNRPRPVLILETLEDRCLLSAGGLLSGLRPFGTAEASPAPVSSVLSSLVSVPTTTLSSVNATVQSLSGAVLAGPVETVATAVPHNLSLNADGPFLPAESLRMEVSLGPVVSDQPLAAPTVGAKIAVGPQADSPLSVAPEVQLGSVGTNVVSADVGAQARAPIGPVLDAPAGAGAGNQAGVAAPVNTSAVDGVLNIPQAGAIVGFTGASTGASLGLIAPAGNVGNAGNTTPSNSPAILAAIFGAPSSVPVLAASRAVDGGGGSGVDAAFSALPITDVPVADGAAADAVPVAPPFDLGGGTDTEIALASPDLEASGLTTRFQPYSLGGTAHDVQSLAAPIGPQSSWLAVWWTRLSHAAPWLTGLIVAGAAFEIRRRRRRAIRAINRPLAG
jgi:hypothetical protein